MGLHWVVSSCVHAFVAGQAQAAPPPDAAQVMPGSAQDWTLRVEQTPLAAVQVTISPETQEVPGTHWPAVVCPGQESASTLQAPSLPQPWSDGQLRSDVQGAPVVVTVQAESRARNTGGASRRIGGRLPEAAPRTPRGGATGGRMRTVGLPARSPSCLPGRGQQRCDPRTTSQMGRKETLH